MNYRNKSDSSVLQCFLENFSNNDKTVSKETWMVIFIDYQNINNTVVTKLQIDAHNLTE